MLCKNCNRDIPSNEKICSFCKTPVSEQINTKKNSGGGLIAVAIVALIFIAVSCNSEQDKKSEKDAFSGQLHKSPSTWDKVEKDRYNDFSDWLSKQ